MAAAASVLHLALARLPLPKGIDPGSAARLILAAAIALLVAFAPTIASQAIIPEAYPLLLLAAAGLLWLCAGWGAALKPGPRALGGLALVAGLGLTTHLTFARTSRSRSPCCRCLAPSRSWSLAATAVTCCCCWVGR